jgi:hypothetical protein
MEKSQVLDIVNNYHNSWVNKNFKKAGSFLAENLKIIVPINNYPTKQSFLAAVEYTVAMVRSVELLSAFSNEHEAIIMYDMTLNNSGKLRIAEHFLVENEKIIQICQIHDTALFRSNI